MIGEMSALDNPGADHVCSSVSQVMLSGIQSGASRTFVPQFRAQEIAHPLEARLGCGALGV